MSLSVLMAVHNGLRHLPAALGSVLEQTHGDFEFIVVDDASDAPAQDYLRGQNDPRIRLLRNDTNRGLTASLNLGLAACSGAWIARMDSDDVCEPDRFRQQLDFLHRRPDLAGCGTWTTDIDDDDRVVGDFRPYGHPDYLRWSLAIRSGLIHPSAMLRREALLAVGGYDERYRYAQDYELFTRMVAAGHRLAILERPLLRYRRGGDSITSTRTSEQRQIADKIRHRHLHHLLQAPVTAEDAAAHHALLSHGTLPASGQLRLGVQVAMRTWRAVATTAGPEAQRQITSELASRLHARGEECLRDRPADALPIAAAMFRLRNHRIAAARLWARAMRCDVGQRRRATGKVGAS